MTDHQREGWWIRQTAEARIADCIQHQYPTREMARHEAHIIATWLVDAGFFWTYEPANALDQDLRETA